MLAAPPSTRERIRRVAELLEEPQLFAVAAVLIAVALAAVPRLTETQPTP